MAKATYIITVDDAHKEHLADVSQRLTAAGMEVQNELHALGAITGVIDPKDESEILRIAGVSHVSRSGQLRAL